LIVFVVSVKRHDIQMVGGKVKIKKVNAKLSLCFNWRRIGGVEL